MKAAWLLRTLPPPTWTARARLTWWPSAGPLVIGPKSPVEGALKESAIHPAPAAVGGDILVVLEVRNARIILEVFEVFLFQQHMLTADVGRLDHVIALERVADHNGVAGAI